MAASVAGCPARPSHNTGPSYRALPFIQETRRAARLTLEPRAFEIDRLPTEAEWERAARGPNGSSAEMLRSTYRNVAMTTLQGARPPVTFRCARDAE